MIKLKSKDYDLKSLFQYDLLREILLSLAEYQNDIHSEIIALKNNYKIHDIRISKLEEKNDIKFDPKEFNINIANFESPLFDSTSENFKKLENNEKNEEKSEKSDEDKKRKKIEDNKDIFGEEEKDDDEDEKKKKMSSKFANLLKENTTNNFPSSTTQNQSTQLNQDLIRNMMKNIRENTEKIADLESQLNKQFERQLKKSKDDLRKDFSNQLLEYKSTFKIFDNRINEIIQKNSDQDKAIEDLTVKSSNFDIFSMFRDSGDGTIDMAKVLVKALEEKVFKKFDLIDLRYKQEANETVKIKKMMENLQPIVEKCEREINDLKEGEQKLKEEIDNLKELIENNNKKYNEIINDKENNINQKIDELKNDIEKKIKENDNDLNNKIKECLKNVKKPNDNEDNENIVGPNNIYDEDTINTIEKKISDLRKKTNDLDNSFKLFMKDSDIEEIKKNIKDIKFEMDQKITKESLKELYNLHLSDVDEIGDLRETVGTLFDDVRKNMKNNTVLTNKVESILGNMMSLQENKSGSQKQIVDFSKYIDNSKLNDVVKNFNAKVEKIFGEIDSLRRDLTDLQIDNKENEKKERVNRLEDDIYNKFTERKTILQKTKNELYKLIKNLEVQIKVLNEEMKQKQDADSWLLAKKPLKCFNCATCEAHIRNQNPPDEYISWNKYPPQSEKDRNNRFGRGFSHMLQMMTYDFINPDTNYNYNFNNNINPPLSDELNNGNNSNINEQNNIHNNNSLIIENSKFNMQNKIAQIERISSNTVNRINKKEIGKSSVPKNNGKLKLPKMFESHRKSKNEDSLPYDEDKNNINVNESYNQPHDNDFSPTIIKITKKKNNQNMYSSYVNSPSNRNFLNAKQSFDPKQRNKDNPYNIPNNNRFSQTIPIP